jgi:hypothetical protein
MTCQAGATIRLRRDTSAAWATANTVLAQAEPGLDTTLNAIKYGDGTTAWNNLPYSGVVPTQLGNLIPEIGNAYTLGNVTNPWKSLYVSGNTIYIGNVQLTTTGNTLLINGNAIPVFGGNVTLENISATGNVTVNGAISSAGNVTGNYFIGNGSQLTGVVANSVGTLANLSVTGNITTGNLSSLGTVSAVSNVSGGNITTVGTVSAVANVSGGNITTVGTVSAAGNITTAGNVIANTFIGSGAALTDVMADRGAAPNNWNTMTQMGVYTVNRLSWSGTVGTPLDSQVFVGLVEVKNSTDTALEQVYYPGTIQSGDVKIQWNRTYWSGSWSSWIKIVNDDQVVVGGTY